MYDEPNRIKEKQGENRIFDWEKLYFGDQVLLSIEKLLVLAELLLFNLNQSAVDGKDR